MELVNIGNYAWNNPKHIVALEILDDDPEFVTLYFVNATKFRTYASNGQTLVESFRGFKTSNAKVWVNPDHIVEVSYVPEGFVIRTTAGIQPEFITSDIAEEDIATFIEFLENGEEPK